MVYTLVYIIFFRLILESSLFYSFVIFIIASDSGGVHSNVRSRFDNGEEDVRQGMTSLALLVDQALVAIHNGDLDKLASLMDQNFALRRSMYGDAVVGAANLRAVGIANMHNLSAKFTGSGGALVCLNRSGAGW